MLTIHTEIKNILKGPASIIHYKSRTMALDVVGLLWNIFGISMAPKLVTGAEDSGKGETASLKIQNNTIVLALKMAHHRMWF